MSQPPNEQQTALERVAGLAAALPAAPSASVYDEYYAFVEPPFSLTPNTRFFFWGGTHSEALEQIMLALRAREGVIVITGATGTGKTMLCWAVAHHVRSYALLSTIVNPTLGPDDLLKQILRDFGVVAPDQPLRQSGYELFTLLEQFLIARIPQGDRAVILIDEAQLLKPEVLEQIRLLSNLESENAKLLQIVLIGLPELGALLSRPEQQQFDQRVSRRCELQPLTAADVARYIDHRLAIAQAPSTSSIEDPTPVPVVISGDALAQRVTFTPEALAEITAQARGIPRLINLLSDRALEMAHQRQTHSIDRDIVRSAASRLKLPGRAAWWPPGGRAAAAAAAFVVVGAIAAFVTGRAPGGTTPVAPAPAAAPPSPGASAAPPPAPAAVVGTLETAPGYVLGAVTFRTLARSNEVLAEVERLGLPAFLRPRGSGHQVMVGPYISVEEARAAAAALAAIRVVNTVTLMIGPPPDSASTPSGSAAVTRVAMLPVEDRASLVLELKDRGVKASRETAEDGTLTVDIGPVTAAVPLEEREAAPDTPLVSRLSIQETTTPDGGRFLRLRIAPRGIGGSSIRVAGNRVYIDLSPDGTRPSTGMALRERIIEPAGAVAADLGSEAGGAPARAQAPAGRPLPAGPLVAAEVLHRASLLAAKPDVRNLERLHEELLTRTPQPDQPLSDETRRMMDEVDRYLSEARSLQLQRDARDFERVEFSRYRRAVQPILARLERLQPDLIAAARRPAPTEETGRQLLALANAEAGLRAIAVPPQLVATHGRVQSALALATDALQHPGEDATRKITEAAALLNWARTDLTAPP